MNYDCNLAKISTVTDKLAHKYQPYKLHSIRLIFRNYITTFVLRNIIIQDSRQINAVADP